MLRFTVATFYEQLDRLLRGRLGRVEVEGEVSEVKHSTAGHVYVTLRERDYRRNLDALLHGVVWRDEWRRLRHKPAVGERVVARGGIGVYPRAGRHQIYILDVQLAGEGDLARLIAERKARLAADGLLDPARKRPLPRFPRVVGIATSPVGAALQDFLKVSRERWPAARILLAPCLVQGAEAPSSVIRALDLLVEDGRADVIVVTRGGGSKEDLLAFPDEQLARFVAACPIPVVSAVGHQVDTTLCDLVADVVAATPTDAAVIVLPDGEQLARSLGDASQALDRAMARALAQRRDRLRHVQARLRHPGERVGEAKRRGAALGQRLAVALRRHVEAASRRLERAEARLGPGGARQLELRRARVERVVGRLDVLSPLAVLGRGYALVRRDDGAVVRSADDLEVGGQASVRLADGSVRVERVE